MLLQHGVRIQKLPRSVIPIANDPGLKAVCSLKVAVRLHMLKRYLPKPYTLKP